MKKPIYSLVFSLFQSIDQGGYIRIPNPLKGEPGPAGQTTFGGVVLLIINVFLLVVGSLAVLLLIWGGLRYITAHGSEEHMETAKRIMKNSIVGIIVVLLAFAIIAVITNVLVGGKVFGP